MATTDPRKKTIRTVAIVVLALLALGVVYSAVLIFT